MSKVYDELVALIESQQAGKENTAVFMVGEQLKDIGAESEANADILLKDLKLPEMNIEKAEAQIKAYADKNKGKANCFCVSPKVADGILREFYGIGEKVQGAEDVKKAPEESGDGFLSLDDFL